MNKMGITNVISVAKNVIDALSEIRNSNLIFIKEALTAVANVGNTISPFLTLIGAASKIISEIINIYETAQYNKKNL